MGPEEEKWRVKKQDLWLDPLQKSKEDEKEIVNNNTYNDDGDFNDKICRYIVYMIYRSRCLSRTTRLVGDIAIFQQYVLVI